MTKVASEYTKPGGNLSSKIWGICNGIRMLPARGHSYKCSAEVSLEGGRPVREADTRHCGTFCRPKLHRIGQKVEVET